MTLLEGEKENSRREIISQAFYFTYFLRLWLYIDSQYEGRGPLREWKQENLRMAALLLKVVRSVWWWHWSPIDCGAYQADLAGQVSLSALHTHSIEKDSLPGDRSVLFFFFKGKGSIFTLKRIYHANWCRNEMLYLI